MPIDYGNGLLFPNAWGHDRPDPPPPLPARPRPDEAELVDGVWERGLPCDEEADW
jgi:hypothetical protein